MSLTVAMIAIWGGGRPQIGGEIKTRDPLAVILAFYPGVISGPTRRELREIADRNRLCSNALHDPPPVRRVLAAE